MSGWGKVKKILLVYDVSYPSVDGGGQRRMYEIATRLTDCGYSVDWVCFKTWENEAINQSQCSINYIGLPGFKGLYNKHGGRRYVEPIEFTIALRRAKLNFNDYDVVWSGQWPIVHLVPWILNKSIRKKLVVDWWEVWGSTWFNYSRLLGPIGYFVERFLINRITKHGIIIGITKSSFIQLQQLSDNDHAIKLIPNGLDTTLLSTIAHQSVKKYDFAYIGRLKNHKNVDLLLRAIKYVEVELQYHASAIIIGDGPEHGNLVNLARELEIDGRINFVGNISDNEVAYSLVGSGKIFVNPSTKEGGGSITALEAFGLGLPVVGFKCKDGIDPEIINQPDRGILVDTICAKNLGKNLYNLLMDEAEQAKMRNRCIEYAKQFDWSELDLEYRKIFNRV